ncbi:MAG TPA: SPOR domain-containing protein [Polyangiaceae bacterium]|nr:SPOR domain-containing protein [Polyangiaceae bacterium]
MNVRNLEQIHEDDPRRRGSRLATLLLASLGGAALVVVGVMSAKRAGPPRQSGQDPLAALVASSKNESQPAGQVDDEDVTFPGILSDQENPTTALAAVKDERGRLIGTNDPLAQPLATAPPVAADRLPVVPLPAGTLLSSTPVTKDPKDSLTQLATEVSKVDDKYLAPPGAEGGFQIQVASFKKQEDAEAFVDDLRKRGHSAFRQAAYVPDRGLWHRVRVGPFKSRYQAELYKKKFEKNERVSPYVVDPHKVKLADEIRAARMAAQKRRDERRQKPR